MQKEAAKIRRKEENILRPPKPPKRLFRIKNNIKKVIIPEMDVDKARPPIFSGNIKIELNTIFITKAKNAIFAGVSVSLRAKKQDCNIFVPP